jgi:hypothetical protein
MRVASAVIFPAVLVAAWVLVGCGQKGVSPFVATVAPTASAALHPVASVIDLMASHIDPAADALWESVAVVSSEKGLEERQPRTDAEWQDVRYKALAVIEGANLLMMEGRRVGHPGQHLSEPGGKGDYTPDQAQAAIDGDRATYIAYARALQDAASIALDAIDKRDADKLLEAGGDLDGACEQCHRRFWYPDAPVPPGT